MTVLDTLQDVLATPYDALAPDPLSSDGPMATPTSPLFAQKMSVLPTNDTLQDVPAPPCDASDPSSDVPAPAPPSPKRAVSLRIPSPPPQPVPEPGPEPEECPAQDLTFADFMTSKSPRKARLPLDMQERNLLLTLVPEPPTPRNPRLPLTPLTPLHRSTGQTLSTPPLTPYIRRGGVPWVDLSTSALPPPHIMSQTTFKAARSVRDSEVAAESFFQRLGPPRRPPFVGWSGASPRPPSSCPVETSGKKDPLSATAGLRRSPRDTGGMTSSKQLPSPEQQPLAGVGSPGRGPKEGKEAHHHPPLDSYLSSWKAHLTLSDDKSWLFYPPSSPTATATPRSPRTKAAPAAAVAAATAAAAAAAAATVAAAAAEDPLANAQDYLAGTSDDEAPSPALLTPAMLTQQTFGDSPRPSPSSQLRSQPPSQPPSQSTTPSGLRRTRRTSLSEQSVEQGIALLRRVRWFAHLPPHQLRTLYARARRCEYPRYSTIIREGNVGRSFYVLMQGFIHVRSLRGGEAQVDITMQPGGYFGEASLCLGGSTDVRREASVYAIEDCSLMQINALDLDGIDVDIGAVKSHLVTLMLSKVSFFKSLPRAVLEQMGAIMDVAYVPTGELIFEEGDPGTEMYILIDGAVQMHKKQIEMAYDGLSWDAVARALGGVREDTRVLAEYNAKSHRPWFGEMAMWNSRPRAATAVCTEPVKMLILHRPQFASFISLVPSFDAMFSTSTKAYDAMDALHRERRQMRAAAEDGDGDGDDSSDDESDVDIEEHVRRKSMARGSIRPASVANAAMKTLAQHELQDVEAAAAAAAGAGPAPPPQPPPVAAPVGGLGAGLSAFGALVGAAQAQAKADANAANDPQNQLSGWGKAGLQSRLYQRHQALTNLDERAKKMARFFRVCRSWESITIKMLKAMANGELKEIKTTNFHKVKAAAQVIGRFGAPRALDRGPKSSRKLLKVAQKLTG